VEVDARAEVVEARKRLLARGLDDGLGGARAHVLDREQAEADGAVLDVELGLGLVDVGRQDLEAHALGLVQVRDELVLLVLGADGRVADLRGEDGGHELDREIGLQVRGLIRDDAVGDGVGLVEAVAAELHHLVVDLVGQLGRDLVGAAALHELVAHLLQLFGDLLAHGLAQAVGFSRREAGELLGDLHDLLLEDHAAVGVLEDGLHQRVIVGDGLAAVLAVHEHVEHAGLHGAGAEQRDQRDDVVEDGGLDAEQKVADALRVQLEHRERLGGAQHLEGLRVVHRDGVDVELGVVPLLHELHGVVDDGEGAQAEEVDLEQAQLRAHVRRTAW